MIKIAYFNDGPLLPIKEGGAEKIINQIRFQNIKSTAEVVLFECSRPWTDTALLSKEKFKTVLLSEELFYKQKNRLVSILKGLNIQGCIFTNPETLLRLGSNLKCFGFKIIYDCHNVFNVFAERTNEPKEKVELMKFMEYCVGQIADLILPCSEVDKTQLVDMGVPIAKLKVVENGVDTTKINYNSTNKKSKTILFLGNLFYQPNFNAVVKIAEHLQNSKLLRKYNFTIAGSAPEDLIQKYSSDRFLFTGYVSNLNETFSNVAIALAPLSKGSGTRLKILNYLSAGIPTIATSVAVEGLDLNDSEIVINDNIAEYPKIIENLINSNQVEALSKNGRNKMVNQYDWRVISKKAINYYLELIGNGNQNS
jgi:glycosyltransferase involved in cell wall biosynthesis